MKLFRDMAPRRRPAQPAKNEGSEEAVPKQPRPETTLARSDRAVSQLQLERARLGRDAVPRKNEEPMRPARQTMEDERQTQPPVDLETLTQSAPAQPVKALETAQAPDTPSIWDLDPPEDAGGQNPAAQSEPSPAPQRARASTPAAPVAASPEASLIDLEAAPGSKVRTRLLGFGAAPKSDAFESAPAAARDVRFPVGWLVVTDGPGCGASFTLTSGLSTIGRGADQSVCLDFGDTAISREGHAAVVYDPEDRRMLISHGGKSNIVRLNGEPLLSREDLGNGDLIRIGKTSLRFVAFCGESFDWSDVATGEAEENGQANA